MNAVLVTGGAGFLGHRLLQQLAAARHRGRLISLDRVTRPDMPGSVLQVIGDFNDKLLMGNLFEQQDISTVIHLAAIVSGQAEADFDLGLSVNLDATAGLLEQARASHQCPRFVFASSVAVFGPGIDCVDDATEPRPVSTYGFTKLVGEQYVTEFSRRGFIDGISVRIPTVAVRPGAPNAAASSFVSGIVREPLSGLPTNCPVPVEQPLWVCSPETAVANLIHAATMDVLPEHPVVNFPGIQVTPGQLVQAMVEQGGQSVLVSWDDDPRVRAIVGSWPGRMVNDLAIRYGFSVDQSADQLVAQFVASETGR